MLTRVLRKICGYKSSQNGEITVVSLMMVNHTLVANLNLADMSCNANRENKNHSLAQIAKFIVYYLLYRAMESRPHK